MKGIETLIETQIRAGWGSRVPGGERQAVFSSAQLDAFGTGKISDCLGVNFRKYDQRRMPRIPNGDLKMMSRVVSISGVPGNFSKPADIAVEYDVPDQPWYLVDQAGVDLPFSLVMETALQPCGFLMAYLDTFSALPEGTYFFRNLDGWVNLVERRPAVGARLTTRAHMVSSVHSSGVLIQKYAFEMTQGIQPFCEGEAVFGYFPEESMINQAGLDNGKRVPPMVQNLSQERGTWVNPQQMAQIDPGKPRYRLSGGRLALVDRLYVQQDGGNYNQGYVYAERTLSPEDWFYPFHFYQDPVMPGSLGVEAILQAVQAYALSARLGQGMRSPTFGLANGLKTEWRYRGQIIQSSRKMELEFHVKSIRRSADQVVLAGDASLWADGLRIYEVKDAGIGIFEG